MYGNNNETFVRFKRLIYSNLLEKVYLIYAMINHYNLLIVLYTIIIFK